MFNKGTAFTVEERSLFGLHGLLPPAVETLEQQRARAYQAYQHKSDDLERHIFLRALEDTNQSLAYSLLYNHIAEMTRIVYTPVVAEGCRHFSHTHRRPRGLFLSFPLCDRLEQLL